MNISIEPLPGLLDDPLLQFTDLPPHNDVRIAPLRDPFPSRTYSVPSPLEPATSDDKTLRGRLKLGSSQGASKPPQNTPKISPTDVTSSRDASKLKVTSISTLVEPSPKLVLPKLLQPSFVSLAAVENKPVPPIVAVYPAGKRLKLDTEHHGDHLHLPKPHQREPSNRVPLLPTILNGIHEPPPSAALLPPMELEEVRAMLATISEPTSIPPEKMLNGPEDSHQETGSRDMAKPPASGPVQQAEPTQTQPVRTWRKWSEEETNQLLKGVGKHGAGKWKEICGDPEFRFCNRRPTDLKDRFRVCMPAIQRENDSARAEPHNDIISHQPRSGLPDTNIILNSSDDLAKTSAGGLREHHLGQQLYRPVYILPPPNKPTPADIEMLLRSRANQRVRKLWTNKEHESILKGFNKHGYQWTAIRNDPELALMHRKATDIRDKFRSLFPSQYIAVEAGPSAAEKRRNSALINGTNKTDGKGVKQKGSTKRPPAAKKIKASLKKRKGSKTDQRTSFARGGSSSVALLAPKPAPTPAPPASGAPTENQGPTRDAAAPVENKIDDNAVPSSNTHDGPSTSASSNLLTLPPLALGDQDWNWDDNKLAPLIDWEELVLE